MEVKKKKVESKDVSTTTLVSVCRNVSSRSLEALGVMLEVKDEMNPSQHKVFFFIQFAGYQPGLKFSTERKSVRFIATLLHPAPVFLCPTH